MSRTESMRSLVEKLLSDRKERQDAVVKLQDNTSQFLQSAQSALETTSKAMDEKFEDARHKRRDNRISLSAAVQEVRSDFQESHRSVADAMRQKFVAYRTERAVNFSKVQEDVAQLRAELSNRHTQMAAGLRESLQVERNSITQEVKNHIEVVNTLLVEIRTSQADQAEVLLEQLRQARVMRAANVEELRTAAKAFIVELQLDRVGSAAWWRMLSSLQDSPGSSTLNVLQNESALDDEPKNDIAVEDVLHKAAGDLESSSTPVDDFTQIKGIGPSSQEKLRNAGFSTFAQLAQASVDDLQNIIGPSASRLVNVEDWIVQAQSCTTGS